MSIRLFFSQFKNASSSQKIIKLLKLCANPVITFYALLWLIVLLIIGTIAQKYIGLYPAQQKYFASFIVRGLLLPIPGGWTVMVIIVIGLTAKLLLPTTWNIRKLGNNIIHLGALLLLIGGFVTAINKNEGSLVIPEGANSNIMEDYYHSELAVLVYNSVPSNKNNKTTEQLTEIRFPHNRLKNNNILNHPEIPFTIIIDDFFSNINIQQLPQSRDATYHGFAKNFRLQPKKGELKSEENLAGINFIISPQKDRNSPNINSIKGKYAIFKSMPIVQTITIEDKKYEILLRPQRTYIPFDIELNDFIAEYHPATAIPRSYKSIVNVIDGEIKQRQVISMNQPLRYKGWTIFQSAFISEASQETTILAVVKNTGRIFPYLSGIIISIGLLLHLFIRLPRLRRKRTAINLLLFGILAASMTFLFPGNAIADEERMEHREYSSFATIPIQHGGRIKPLDTFAIAHLVLFSGRSSLGEISAIEWLAETMFAPEDSFQRRIFKIRSPDLADTLEMAPNKKNMYSFYQIATALRNNQQTIEGLNQMDKELLTKTQLEMLDLSKKSILFFEISRSFSLFSKSFSLESPILAQSLGLKAGTKYNYLEILKSRQRIVNRVAVLHSKQVAQLTSEEIELLTIADLINSVSGDSNSLIMRVIPPQWQESGDTWLSPWGSIISGGGSPANVRFFSYWNMLSQAYKHAGEWNKLSVALQQESISLSGIPSWRLELEVAYNNYQLFFKSFLLYVLAAIVAMIAFFVKRNPVGLQKQRPLISKERLLNLSLIIISIGLAIHFSGIVVRMIILSRPPVSTFYESIIFVAAVTILIGIILELIKRTGSGILIACASGIILHSIGFGHLSDGNSMQMLTAVLNTNYWLATHVVIITLGYGSCLVTGILAHIFLAMRALKIRAQANTRDFTQKPIHKPIHSQVVNAPGVEAISQNMLAICLISLFLMITGTILGGIWADQSWGRFWGWDPKENGAMLIILWLLLMLHGRFTSFINDDTFAAGMIGLNIAVVLSWFGVNLLGIGLHSYGFIENVALGMAIFIGSEIAYIVVAMVYIKRTVNFG